MQYIPKHIKKHQGDWVDLEDLDMYTVMNIEVNYCAKRFREEMLAKHIYISYTTPTSMWKISMLCYRVYNHLVQYLRESIEGGKVAGYWIYKRKQLTMQRYFQVDWETNKLFMKTSPML